MDNPSLYYQSNHFPRRDAKYFIDNYLPLMKWRKSGDNVLDVGTGDGFITLNLLLPRFPKDFNKLVCLDISKKMLQFAKNMCTNYKVDFLQQDIGSIKIPLEFHKYFNHIFSFYCLHWVQDQQQAFKNLFKMLKPGGDILLTFMAQNPVFEIFENMGKLNKWNSYMYDFKEYICPYQKSENAAKEVKNILEKQGFVIHVCKVKELSYTFPNLSSFTEFIASVNPFVKRISQNEIDDYLMDSINEAKKVKTITTEICSDDSHVEKFNFTYKICIVFASKPSDPFTMYY